MIETTLSIQEKCQLSADDYMLKSMLELPGSLIKPSMCKNQAPLVFTRFKLTCRRVNSEKCLQLCENLERLGFGTVVKTARSFQFEKRIFTENDWDEGIKMLGKLQLSIEYYHSRINQVQTKI
jgi:hypothetical protein